MPLSIAVVKNLERELHSLELERKSDTSNLSKNNTQEILEQIEKLQSSWFSFLKKHEIQTAQEKLEQIVLKNKEAEQVRRGQAQKRSARIEFIQNQLNEQKNWALASTRGYPFAPFIQKYTATAFPKHVSIEHLGFQPHKGANAADGSTAIVELHLSSGLALLKTQVNVPQKKGIARLQHFIVFDFFKKKILIQGIESSLQDFFTNTEVYPAVLVQAPVTLANLSDRVKEGGKHFPERFNAIAAVLKTISPFLSQEILVKIAHKQIERPEYLPQMRYALNQILHIRHVQQKQSFSTSRQTQDNISNADTNLSLDFWLWYWLVRSEPSTQLALSNESLMKISLLPENIQSDYLRSLALNAQLSQLEIKNLETKLIQNLELHWPSKQSLDAEIRILDTKTSHRYDGRTSQYEPEGTSLAFLQEGYYLQRQEAPQESQNDVPTRDGSSEGIPF